jgi:aryl sulfotransferase
MKSLPGNIIWLASYPKSGNTWVRIFLQQVMGSNEAVSGFPDLNEIPIASNRNLIDHYLGVNSSDLLPEEIREYRPEVYRMLAAESEKLRVMKLHDAFEFISDGTPMFPAEITKSVIYVVRNPLDVAVSYSFHTGKSFQAIIDQMNDPEFALSTADSRLMSQVPQFIGTWSGHLKSWTRQPYLPVILIHYEKLLDDSAAVFRELLARLEIPFSESQLKSAVDACRFDQLKIMEESHGFREKPIQARSFFREGKKDNYKKYLSLDQIRQVCHAHQDMMIEMGYKTETL